MLDNLHAQWASQIHNLPLMMLQAAAVVGILSVVLVCHPKSAHLLRSYGTHYGAVLGISGFLLVGLAYDILNMPGRPYLMTDVVFLGGLLGGWRGGLIGWACLWSARLLFGGLNNGIGAGIDMAVISLGGVLMHGWIVRRKLSRLGLRDVLWVWAVKMCFSVGSVMVIRMLALVPAALSMEVIKARVFGALVSFMVTGSVLYLLRREARERESVARQRETGLTEPLTGLPNRKALAEHLDALLGQQPDLPNTLITLELANIGDMVRLHGHEWSDGFWRGLVPVLGTPHLAEPLALYQPRYFMFSDLTLVMVLQGISLERVQRTGLASHLHEELADALRATNPGGLVPQLRMGVAMGNDEGLAAPGRVVGGRGGAGMGRAAPILRNLNLALLGDTRPLRYFHRSFADKLALDEELRQMLVGWISRSQAPLFYQPKCDLGSGRVIGAEGLLRATDARGNPVPPPLVLEVAVRNQLLIELEWCTIETVVRAIGVSMAAGQALGLAVNVSAASLTVPGFGQRVIDLLQGSQTPCRLLSVEITENSPVPDIETVGESLLQLSEAGVRLSLDDFGTGYSALSMLAKFPFNEVKIDHSMVARLDQPRMRAAVSLAFESARRYNATLVAEGVETRQQLDTLLSLGITRGQGYFFARAMPLEDLLGAGPMTLPATPRASRAPA